MVFYELVDLSWETSCDWRVY